MKSKFAFLFITQLCTWAASGYALEWRQRQLRITPEPGATDIRGSFQFRNPTKGIVHIVDLTTSCGCTIARTVSPDIAPGATGTIEFVFTVGKRTGFQEKRIFVQTDESPDPMALELHVQLPDAAGPRGV